MDTVIFDMDGVIIDSEPIHRNVEQSMFRDLNLEVSPHEHLKYTGTASLEMWTDIATKHRLNIPPEELTQKNEQNYLLELQSMIELPAVKGVRQLIHHLHENGFKLALASSSSREHIDVVLKGLQIGDFFSVRVSGAELPRSKPDPMIFLKTADLIKKKPEQCCVIEDSFHGVTAARAAGMKCIGYRNPNSGNQDLSKADIIIDDFHSSPIEEIFKKL